MFRDSHTSLSRESSRRIEWSSWFVCPDLAVYVGVSWHHHGFLRVVLFAAPWERELLEFLSLSVEFRDASLVHHRKAKCFHLVEVKLERSSWKTRV